MSVIFFQGWAYSLEVSYCIYIFIYENHFNLYGIRKRIPYSHVSNNEAAIVYAREKNTIVFSFHIFFFVNDSVFINIFLKKRSANKELFIFIQNTALYHYLVSSACLSLLKIICILSSRCMHIMTLHTQCKHNDPI